MQNFFETVVMYDAKGCVEDIIDYVQTTEYDNTQIEGLVYYFLTKARLNSALALARLLDKDNNLRYYSVFALSVGGLWTNNQEEEQRGLKLLTSMTDDIVAKYGRQMDSYDRDTYNEIITPVMSYLLTAFLEDESHTRVLRLLDIVKARMPYLRPIFDWQTTVPPLSLPSMYEHDDTENPFTLPPIPPPANVSLPQRSVVVVMHETAMPEPVMHETGWLNGQSSQTDSEPPIVSSMRSYGWNVLFVGVRQEDDVSDGTRTILSAFRQQEADILVLDHVFLQQSQQERVEMMAQIRQEKPLLKIIGCYADSWKWDTDLLRETVELLDAVWVIDSPSHPLWNEPAVANKVLHMPSPWVESASVIDQPLDAQMQFTGSISKDCWLPAFWTTLASHVKLPVEGNWVIPHQDKDQIKKDDILNWEKQAKATCRLDFTMRSKQVFTITNQSFETIFNGALLIQEFSPDMHRYFIPGKHYLEFSTVTELASICRFITENRAEAEEIRRCGYAFARQYYSPQNVIYSLDALLYPPATSQRTPVMLSICIPTFNRQNLLAHTLDNLKWTLDAGIDIEIIVSDNASDDDTEKVAKEKGKMFPHFRYVRQKHNIGANLNWDAVMKLARGKYSIPLTDDDYLIPEAVLAEIEYLNEHDDIIGNYASALMWDDHNQKPIGLTYEIDDTRIFNKSQSMDLFQYLLEKTIFPEFAIYRTESYANVLFDYVSQLSGKITVYPCFIWAFKALKYGNLRFHSNIFYKVVINTPLKDYETTLLNSGLVQVTTFMDQYRSGIELACSIALSNQGIEKKSLSNDYYNSILSVINTFVNGRLSVAVRICRHQKNFTVAAEFLRRWYLTSTHGGELTMILELEQEVVSCAIIQIVAKLFEILPGAKCLVICDMRHPDRVQQHFQYLVPDVPTVIQDLPLTLIDPDRFDCLYLTDQKNVHAAIRDAGIEAGRVLSMPELLYMFRITDAMQEFGINTK